MKQFAKFAFILMIVAGTLGCAAESADKEILGTDGKPSAGKVVASAAKAAAKPAPTIPDGTRLSVLLIDSLDSQNNSDGDTFLASLAAPLTVDGMVVLETGTKFQGRVLGVKESGKVKGLASIQLALTAILLDNGKKVPITTNTFSETAKGTKKRDTGIIAGGAGIGAAIGAIAGGKKGAGIGAIAGGGAGTGAVLVTNGKNIHYAPETRLNFVLVGSVHL